MLVLVDTFPQNVFTAIVQWYTIIISIIIIRLSLNSPNTHSSIPKALEREGSVTLTSLRDTTVLGTNRGWL